MILYDLGTNRDATRADHVARRTGTADTPSRRRHRPRSPRADDRERTASRTSIHLAAMLVPLVKADPTRGAAVNVVGTTNVFEAAKRQGVRGIAYASSAAVYGPAPDHGSKTQVSRRRSTESSSSQTRERRRSISEDDGVGSVGPRPHVVYGPGRDQGLTADPTLAMEAAARGRVTRCAAAALPAQFAADAARIFIAAARSEHGGAAVFNLGGPSSHASDVVSAIEAAAPEVAGRITFEDVQLPFPEEMESGRARGRRRPDRVDDASRGNASNDRALPARVSA